MQPMEKNVEKQLVVRTFEPDMNALKQTAKQLAHMQDTSLNLYGQAGEVLIVVTARAYAQAAATELTENVAEQFELALGPAAYGRGKGSLAYFTAGELIQSESTISAADPATGALLAEEFSHTKRGPSVFDFGDGSYNDSRVVAKIKNAVYKYAEEGNAPQIAAARAAAAARFAHADFGVASVGMGTGAEVVYLAVAHRGYVYIKRIKNGEGAGKVVALSALDMVRRLAQKQPVDRARMFKANSDFDWNAPLKQICRAHRGAGRAAGCAGRGVLVFLHTLFTGRRERRGRRAACERQHQYQYQCQLRRAGFRAGNRCIREPARRGRRLGHARCGRSFLHSPEQRKHGCGASLRLMVKKRLRRA